ncbi:HPP family protein [Spirosoma aerolatum]|uniref:HPP family protein n=1 Tax=Spirosoma aerolatum TaxID=1211326 RepID=UPI0009ADC665|nr:HPP family protein [Spirosoma aerolatum]
MQTAIRWALYILGIEILFLVALAVHHFSLVPPLAASCILLAANPKGVFAQPRTVLVAYILVGHLGLFQYVFFGNNLFGLMAMTILAVSLMAAVSSIHPPAIAMLFLLARAAHPFQEYLFMVLFVVAMVGFHYAAQWWLSQLYPSAQANPRGVTESKLTAYSTYLATAENQ